MELFAAIRRIVRLFFTLKSVGRWAGHCGRVGIPPRIPALSCFTIERRVTFAVDAFAVDVIGGPLTSTNKSGEPFFTVLSKSLVRNRVHYVRRWLKEDDFETLSLRIFQMPSCLQDGKGTRVRSLSPLSLIITIGASS